MRKILPINVILVNRLKNFNRLLLATAAICIIIINQTTAQVHTSYTFSQSAGTYTAISGTPVSALAGASVDDNVAKLTVGTVPFTFNYYGNAGVVNLNTVLVTVCSNGWICLGSSNHIGSAPLTGNDDMFYGPSSKGVIAAFSADLAGTNTSTVEYATLGSSPNRIFVIQWKDFTEVDQSASPQQINFQIRLYETSNNIEVVYGSFTNLISSSTLPQVGLRGSSSADINARKGSSWDNSIDAVNDAYAAMPYLNNFPYVAGVDYPKSGTIYKWTNTGTGSCSGTPAAGTANTSPAEFCSIGSVTLSLTGASTGTGIDYQWQSGPSASGPWANVVAGNPAVVNNIVTTTYFQAIVSCSGSGQSATTSPVKVTVNVTPEVPGTISGTNSICSGSTNTYSIAPVTGATSYSWTLPSGWTGTSTTNSISATASVTSGNISVTAKNACGDSPAQNMYITVNVCTGIEKLIVENRVSVYPNPAYNFISVDLKRDEKGIAILYNLLGERIIVQSFSGNLHPFNMDVEKVSCGLYILQFIFDDGTVQENKIIKKN